MMDIPNKHVEKDRVRACEVMFKLSAHLLKDKLDKLPEVYKLAERPRATLPKVTTSDGE